MQRTQKGITLVALVITIVVLLILTGITITQLTGNGLFSRTLEAEEENDKQTATETINLKITNIQISSYAENKELPTLQYLADKLCEDNDMEYVTLASKTTSSLDKIDVTNVSSIYTKLKDYSYEFEINSSLQLASINGVKIATTEEKIPEGYIKPSGIYSINSNGEYDISQYEKVNVNVTTDKEYNLNIYDKWDTWLNLAGITDLEQYNDTNIVENETLMNKLLSSDNAIDYMLKSKYFIMPTICSSEKAMKYLVQKPNLRRTVILDRLWKEKIIQNGFINIFDQVAVKIPTSSVVTNNMIFSSTNSTCSITSAFNGYFPTSGWSDSYLWIPAPSEKGSYIGYNFGEYVTLYKISITACCYEASPRKYSFIVQGLNSNGTWENIGEEYIANVKRGVFETYNYYMNSNKAYCGYRIKNNYSSSGNGDIYWHKLNTNAFGIGELQFYCVK